MIMMICFCLIAGCIRDEGEGRGCAIQSNSVVFTCGASFHACSQSKPYNYPLFISFDAAITYQALGIFQTEYHPNVLSGKGKAKEGFSIFGVFDRTRYVQLILRGEKEMASSGWGKNSSCVRTVVTSSVGPCSFVKTKAEDDGLQCPISAASSITPLSRPTFVVDLMNLVNRLHIDELLAFDM